MKHAATFLTPRRALLGIPADVTGEDVRILLTDSFFPAHRDIAPTDRRNVQWLDSGGQPCDPVALTEANPGKGQHGLGRAAVAGGSGAASGGRYSGVAPNCDMVLLSFGVRDGKLCAAPEQRESYLEFLLKEATHLSVRAVQFGGVGDRTGPLVPWQWDTQRRYCEEISSKGVLVVSPTGNCPGSFSPTSLAPSALVGGGLELPAQQGGVVRPFHSPEGVTFEGKHVPDHVAPAENVVVPALVSGDGSGVDGVPLGYGVDEGTSFSGPFVAGLLACVWQKHPDIGAREMRALIQHAAQSVRPRFGHTPVGMPTWEAVESAVDLAEDLAPAGPMPLERYTQVQRMSWARRLALIRDDPSRMADILLNSLPSPAPEDHAKDLIAWFSERADQRARAAIVLLLAPCDLTGQQDHVLLDSALQDESPLVVGCALDVMRRCPALATGREEELARLFDHANGQVRYEALLVAEVAPRDAYVRPLVKGMARDLEQGPLIAFFVRRRCLKSITGESCWPETRRALPGECVYSDYWLRKQYECMERWQGFITAG